ncbi:hypothetical protein [Pseudalkalibacillus caeni]|uniref:Uncharacterized protein n=1 Tax=Exobacillus caeni TaxID=2574798 RepID=A0A5R9FAM2_9BACL|nr:hypothetical protein [Pseudalkalibacillus caeni]TLS36675.1 hypothetical protein FCL54_14235 [Pseudalkalibacillus caeni]
MKEENIEKQYENLKKEGVPSSALNDAINSGFEAYPGHLESTMGDDDALTSFEESIVEHSLDGKTWNSNRKNEEGSKEE